MCLKLLVGGHLLCYVQDVSLFLHKRLIVVLVFEIHTEESTGKCPNMQLPWIRNTKYYLVQGKKKNEDQKWSLYSYGQV